MLRNGIESLQWRLIGQQNARLKLSTPALVIELDILEHNIAVMARWALGSGVALRPHAKSHKSVDIGRRQIDAGATGLCCAKLGEAEALAACGIGDLLITSPIVTPQAIERLVVLNGTATRLAIVTDHPGNVAHLAEAVAAAGQTLRILVDVDPGVNRTGVTPPDAAVMLAQEITRHPVLRYAGVQFYCRTRQHIPSYKDRQAAVAERTAYSRGVIDALRIAGLPPEIVTGGGTGSHHIDAALGVLTEVQPGSYVFMDRQYASCDLHGTATPVFGQSLQLDTRVVSANTPGRATIDAGLKAMATEAGPPGIQGGADAESIFAFMGDEHGLITSPAGKIAPLLGAVVTLIPPHCDPTANLYDHYHVVRGCDLVDIWPVTARGRSQ